MSRKIRTTSSTRKNRAIDISKLKNIEPLTDAQEKLFNSYDNEQNIVAHGVAGTGKTYCLLYKALYDVLDYRTPYQKVYIVRSLVPTREIGFLPGGHDDKAALYEIPYKRIVTSLFDLDTDEQQEMIYSRLKLDGVLSFWSTSFIRGTTFTDSIIIVDEFENMSGHELDSIITRIGENCKIHFSGDEAQTDLVKTSEKNGIFEFMKIMRKMESMDIVEFGIDDIVRSGFVRQYLMVKYDLNIKI